MGRKILITVEAMVEKTKFTAKTIYRWAAAGKIPGTIKIYGELRFDEAIVDSWLESLMVSDAGGR